MSAEAISGIARLVEFQGERILDPIEAASLILRPCRR
jgi:hypothetical protein